MSGEWFMPEGCKQRKGYAMPARDLTPGSTYMKALEMLEDPGSQWLDSSLR